MDKRTDIFILGEDILYLVLKQLFITSRISLLYFANASRACEKLAGPILFRSITLGDKDSQIRTFFERLLNKDDRIHNYVKEVKIRDWGEGINNDPEVPTAQNHMDPSVLEAPFDAPNIRNGDSKTLPSSELEQALENVRNLESFSWNARSIIPERVISKLEKLHPNARLCVTNNLRNEKTSDGSMDVRLLSSPNLYSLNYSIFYGSTSSGIVCSEFQTLKDILVQSPKLEVMSLAIYLREGRQNLQIPKAPKDWHPYLPAGSGDPLWKLHTLKIPDSTTHYAQQLSRVYSTIFTQSHGFKHLRRLDLNNVCGYHSFEPLKGQVPNLKHLELAFRIQDPNNGGWARGYRCRDPVLVRQFIESISGLEVLQITNHEASFDVLWPAILKHRGTLQRLAIHTVPDQEYKRDCPPVLTSSQLERLQDSKISHLAFDVLIQDISWYSKSDTGLFRLDLDPSTALCLACFSGVETLKLYIELPVDATVFSEHYNYDSRRENEPIPPLIEKKAKEVAIGVYQQIFEIDPKASLRELELCFCRLKIGDRLQSKISHNSLWLRKAEIDYIKKPKDSGYEVEFQGKWDKQRSEW